MSELSLVTRFLEEELTDYVRDLILGTIEYPPRNNVYLTFNAFNVRLDFVAGVAVIDDELDPSQEETLTLDALRRALEARR